MLNLKTPLNQPQPLPSSITKTTTYNNNNNNQICQLTNASNDLTTPVIAAPKATVTNNFHIPSYNKKTGIAWLFIFLITK